jgi:uncharacterized low-complexity protein
MNTKNLRKPLALAVGAAIAGSLASLSVAQAASPFALTALGSAYMAAGEGSCGANKPAEGKCGGDKAKAEGKCGEGKCGADKAKGEGKCGEGKCGADKKKEGEKAAEGEKKPEAA